MVLCLKYAEVFGDNCRLFDSLFIGEQIGSSAPTYSAFITIVMH